MKSIARSFLPKYKANIFILRIKAHILIISPDLKIKSTIKTSTLFTDTYIDIKKILHNDYYNKYKVHISRLRSSFRPENRVFYRFTLYFIKIYIVGLFDIKL